MIPSLHDEISQRYRVTGVSPKCGIAAGGTLLSVSGEDLNIGIGMSVVVAGTMCELIGHPTRSSVSYNSLPKT